MIITIDGPVGSGKSTVARELSKQLKIYYLNTGLLYRAVAYILLYKLRKTVDTLAPLSEKELSLLEKINYEYKNGQPVVHFEMQDLTENLFKPELSDASSIVSASRQVREKLLPIQRGIAKKYDIIADGRDCGSVVFPDADHKFFLTASVDVRADRVLLDERRGYSRDDLEKVKSEIKERDERDKTRQASPLIVPDGSFILDNSEMSFEQTVTEFLRQIRIS